MAYEIISEAPIGDLNAVSASITNKALEHLGVLGVAEAGIIILNDKYNKEMQRGIIRVNNKSVDKLRAALAFIDQIDNKKVIVRSVGVSGMIGKAQAKYTVAAR